MESGPALLHKLHHGCRVFLARLWSSRDLVDTELLDVRERLPGPKVERSCLDSAQWKAAYAAQGPGPLKEIMAIGIAGELTTSL